MVYDTHLLNQLRIHQDREAKSVKYYFLAIGQQVVCG